MTDYILATVFYILNLIVDILASKMHVYDAIYGIW